MYDLVSFVSRGSLRRDIVINLKNPLTPTQLAEKVNNHRSSVSRSLLELESKSIVICVTPKERMGRYYKLTQKGKDILAVIENE